MALGDTASFCASVRRHTGIAETHPSVSDALTLADATEELHGYLLPLGMGERQELWAGPTGRLSVPVVNGTATYAISPRAVGGKVRAARLVDSAGNPVHLNYYGREEVARAYNQSGMPSGLTVEGSTLRLFPVPQGLSGYTLEVDIYIRPAELVPLAETGYVLSSVASDGTTAALVVLTDEAEALYTLATELDVVSATAPFDTRVLEAMLLSALPAGGGTYEFVLDGEFALQPGDFLCLPGQAPVVQAPLEWHPLLALKVATRQLASLGDNEAVAAKGRELLLAEKRASTIIRPRREDVMRAPANGMDRWRRG